MVGRTVAQYQLLEKLGAGGMGEIYKAQDTRLNRLVAIKVLPSARSNDPERRKRFLLEAQAASALNHPSIITIHDVISQNDAEFMVMELVSGKTLNDAIPKGGLRVPQALNYALQMADALSAAHNAGIVHRDLKPANAMITDSGYVKILDFGLAKLMERNLAVGSERFSDRDVTSMGLTMEGAIIGTVNYMSPEQAQGKSVNARSDIFSFGAVFYEMLTGRHAFEGDTSVSTLSAILRDDVKPMIEVVPDVPQQLEMVIRRCMSKDPDQRWQTMQEVRNALAVLKRESDSGLLYTSMMSAYPATPASAQGSKKNRSMLFAATALALMSIVGGGLWLRATRKPDRQTQVAPAQLPAVQPEAQLEKPVPKTADETLTNDSIVTLVQQKVPVDVILSHIRSTKTTSFDLSTPELIRLTKAGVPATVIDQMRTPGAVAAAAPARTTNVAVADGTPFRIALEEAIPADASLGLPLRFTVFEDLRIDGTVLISKGAVVYGEITETPKKKKFFGIGNGKLSFSLAKAQAASGTWLNIRALASPRNDGVSQRPVEPSGKKESKTIAAPQGTIYIAYVDGSQSSTVLLK